MRSSYAVVPPTKFLFLSEASLLTSTSTGYFDDRGDRRVADARPMKSSDGRFAYEAAGDLRRTPLVFLHGIGGAARGWRKQLEFFGERYHAVAWDMPGYGGSAPLPTVSIAALADALCQFLREFADSPKPILVGHSIGGMIVQQWLVSNPVSAKAAVLAQTSSAFGKPDGDWQKAFIDARLGPLDRGQTLASLAPSLVSELVGDDPDLPGMDLARDCMASVPRQPTGLSTGPGRVRSPSRAQDHKHSDPPVGWLKGQQCAGANDGEDGHLRDRCQLCRD